MYLKYLFTLNFDENFDWAYSYMLNVILSEF